MSNYWSGKGAGSKIVIKFDKPLLGDVTGNEDAFTIKGMVRNPLKYGPLVERTFTVESVERYPLERYWRDEWGGDMEGVEVTGAGGIGLESQESRSGAYINFGSTITASGSFVMGWEFRVGAKNIVVDKLRIYSGSANSKTIKLWTAAGVELRSVTVNALNGQWVEGNIPEIILQANTNYVVSSQWSSQTYYRDDAPASAVYDPRITRVQGRYSTSGFPNTVAESRNYGIADIVIKSMSYLSPGTYTTTTPADTLPTNPRLKWTEDLPAGTSITAEYAVNQDDETPPETWIAINNADLLTIPDPATGYFLWLRFTLATTDTAVTPTLLSVWLEEAEAPPDTILLTMTPDSRFNDVEGDITVSYDQTKGNLSGTRPVEDFTESFTPTDLEPTPIDRHDITAGIEVAVGLIKVDYRYFKDDSADHIITAGITVDVALIPVSEIPP